MRKFVAASLVLVIATAVASADEFVGFITKFENGKMTVMKSKGTEPPEEVTLKVADNVKIVRGKVNMDTQKIEASEAFEGGKDALTKEVKETAERVQKYIEEGKKGFGLGVFASIVTEGDTVTEIRVTGGGKKKQPAVASAQQQPTTGYAPINGLKMYYEVHGSGHPVVLLHGSFMTITNNWTGWIGELSKTRQVIAIEMQGHGRTADIEREFSYENLADDVAALLDHLKIPSADLIGYSMGGGVAMQCAIRHPEKVRKVVIISSAFRLDGMVKEAIDMFPKLTAEMFKGSPIETEYKKLSPTPDEFPNFVKHVISVDLKPYDFGAENLKATQAPMFFIHGDADGVRLDHISEMFRLKGGETHGDMGPRTASRLAIIPDATHVTLMERMTTIVPMVNDFLDAKPQRQE